MQNKKLNKIKTVLAVLLLIFTIFSLSYILAESNHHCCHDDCPICFVLHVVKTNIEILLFTLSGLEICIFHQNLKKKTQHFAKSHKILNTLILQKIRLND